MSLVRFTKKIFRDNPGYTPKHLYFKLWDKTSKITPEQCQIDLVTGKITGEYTYTHRDQDNNEQKYTGHVIMKGHEYYLQVNYRSNHSMKQRILPLYVIPQNEFMKKMKGIRYINHTMSHSRGGGKRKSTYKKHINF